MKIFKGYKTVKVKIKGKNYNLWVADTNTKRKIGLSKIKKLPPRTGMIFCYDNEVQNSFTMRNTSLPLTIIFLDRSMKILEIYKARPYQNKLITPKTKYSFVIEI